MNSLIRSWWWLTPPINPKLVWCKLTIQTASFPSNHFQTSSFLFLILSLKWPFPMSQANHTSWGLSNSELNGQDREPPFPGARSQSSQARSCRAYFLRLVPYGGIWGTETAKKSSGKDLVFGSLVVFSEPTRKRREGQDVGARSWNFAAQCREEHCSFINRQPEPSKEDEGWVAYCGSRKSCERTCGAVAR